VTGDGAGVSYRAFVEVEVGFADGAEIEAAGEALGGQGVVEQSGEPKVEADGEEEGKEEIEEVGPEESGEAPQSERQAVEEDTAAFRHCAEPRFLAFTVVWRRPGLKPLCVMAISWG
jgi:hypothetical protein